MYLLFLSRMHSQDTPHSLFGDLHVHHLFQFLIDQLVGEEGVAHRHVHSVTLYWEYCSAQLQHLLKYDTGNEYSLATPVIHSLIFLKPICAAISWFIVGGTRTGARAFTLASSSCSALRAFSSFCLLISSSTSGGLGNTLLMSMILCRSSSLPKNAFLIQWHTMDFILLSLTQVF